jgi:hypothetical protein
MISIVGRPRKTNARHRRNEIAASEREALRLPTIYKLVETEGSEPPFQQAPSSEVGRVRIDELPVGPILHIFGAVGLGIYGHVNLDGLRRMRNEVTRSSSVRPPPKP